MSEAGKLQHKASALRRAFDQAFALSPPPPAAEVMDLLAIGVAGAAYAIKLRDIAGVVTSRKLTALPASAPGLLGLAGIRGSTTPVFDLASLLGYPTALESPRWLILCGTEEPIALACSDFEGYLRLPKSSVHADPHASAARPYVHEVASTEAGLHAVIDIPLVVSTIRTRAGHNAPAKEP